MESIIQANDQYFSENLASNVRRGMKSNAKDGKFNGGTPPLGYKIVNGYFEIEKTEAKIVKKIFELYIKHGKGLIDIAMYLNQKGYKTKLNRPFKQTSIYDILHNQKYVGIYEYKLTTGEVIKSTIPAIIDEENFNMVKKISKQNSKRKGSFSAKHTYLLSGLIKCGECGQSYVGNTSTKTIDGKKYQYKKYNCNGRNKMYGCKNITLNAENLELFVLNVLRDKLTNKENLNNLLSEIESKYTEYRSCVVDSYDELSQELKSIEQKLANYMKAIEDGLYTTNMKESINSLELRKQDLKILLNEAETRKNQKNIKPAELLDIFNKELGNYENLSDNEKKNLFRRYIQKIEVNSDQIVIDFNISSLNTDSNYPYSLPNMAGVL